MCAIWKSKRETKDNKRRDDSGRIQIGRGRDKSLLPGLSDEACKALSGQQSRQAAKDEAIASNLAIGGAPPYATGDGPDGEKQGHGADEMESGSREQGRWAAKQEGEEPAAAAAGSMDAGKRRDIACQEGGCETKCRSG
jgi:hypothetical protein